MLSLAAVLAAGLATSQSNPSPCSVVDARLQVAPAAVKKGQVPQFILVLRNTSEKPLRYVDTRSGGRRDLVHALYRLVVEDKKGKEPNVSQAISDPGPVRSSDYGYLEPAATVEIQITTPMSLDELRKGMYKAYVILWPDPSQDGPPCRSTTVDFRVQ